VGARQRFVIPLSEVKEADGPLVGGKAARLAALAMAGFSVPGGFCLTIKAYQWFVNASRLGDVIRMELGRKVLADMRWEEIWDASLRIRSAFSGATIPAEIASEIADAIKAYPADTRWAVRSTAPGEDSTQRSFAGIHESYLGVTGLTDVLDAVRLVWASLWSDAAMLYRRELDLDPSRSNMAVLLQPVRSEPVSGVAFGRDPRQPLADYALIEAVPGQCSGLVDGEVDPDRWKLVRSSGKVFEYQPGRRDGSKSTARLLDDAHLLSLNAALGDVEALFQWPPDLEWTGKGKHLTLLQARPITAAAADPDEKRAWYLTLRPSDAQLRALGQRVVHELIPELESLGGKLAAESIDDYGDAELATVLEERLAMVRHWRQIYKEEFIPFAHGVRRLAVYYNDAVRPEDPYEFVGLLTGEPLLAVRRNSAIAALAGEARDNPAINEVLRRASECSVRDPNAMRESLCRQLLQLPEGACFAGQLETLLDEDLDIAYHGDRLSDRLDLILHHILELADSTRAEPTEIPTPKRTAIEVLEERLMGAVGPDRQDEARELLRIGRISWRLRDNDNLLLARVEAQFLRAVQIAAGRLRDTGRLASESVAREDAAGILIDAMRDVSGGTVTLPKTGEPEPPPGTEGSGERPRQLVGQPAAPGMQKGLVRCVRTTQDLGRFKAGEVLVCDSIQPMMTHLVPLACAVVERRGGMLIHGAIIARELGIPCVNGVAAVIDSLEDGELVTVDGYLGIVTVGEPEFDLELADHDRHA